jgi:DNA ligase (NAD+)
MQTSTPVDRLGPFAQRDEFDQAVTHARDAGTAYYAGVTPLMADDEYDQLVARIAATTAAHPDWDSHGVLTEVAVGAPSGEIRHATPMLSLDKATTPTEVARFIDTLDGATALAEVKVDGMAVRVTYRQGRIVQAATRGDGTTGENITAQLLRGNGIAGLPTDLLSHWSGDVAGEVFMTHDDFEEANANRVAYGKTAFANPRNAVAGSLRKLDPGYHVPMSFAAYAIGGTDLANTDSYLERMAFAKALGIQTTWSLTIDALPPDTPARQHTDTDVNTAISAIGAARARLPYPIDGVVVKADDRQVRTRLGNGSRSPRWALAYKFAPDTTFSTLRDIEVAVGRTGRASFRAVIDPVAVDGTTIAFASLHHAAWITGQRLGIGSRVAVVRAGDVIPRVTAAAGDQPADVQPWEPPRNCPQCDQPWDTSTQLWRCTTPACSVVGRIVYAATRDVWDIDGLGEEIATALVDAGLVSTIADLFDLTVKQLGTLTLGGRAVGTATAERILAGIAAAKQQPLNRHITALGIRMTGRRVGQWLASRFGSLDALRAATVDELASIEGIGPEKARTIHAGLQEMSDVLDRLVAAGITTETEPATPAGATDNPLTGKRVVITGTVPGLNRTEAQEAAEALGAIVSGSVSKNTDLVVVGSGNSTRGKLARAEQLGIATMTAEQFVAVYQENIG